MLLTAYIDDLEGFYTSEFEFLATKALHLESTKAVI